MLIPNLAFVLFGEVDHLNTQSIMYCSAALFIVSWGCCSSCSSF